MRQPNAKLRLSALCLLAGLCATAPLDAAEAPTLPRWSTNVDEAIAEAKRLKRPLLMHFYADWCGPCHRMEREVLNTSPVMRQLGRGFVAVKVNSDRHPELIERFDIRTLPSDVVIDPAGRVIAQSDGFQNVQMYQARLASVDRRFRNATRVNIARSGSGGVESQPAPRDNRNRAGARQKERRLRDGIDRSAVDVGLNGYSPISLWNERRWQKGRAEFAWTHKGVVYLMRNAQERDQFRANPERYASQFLGCDPVVISESRRAVRGNPQYGAYFSGMLFLFATAETRMKFQRAPHRYSRSRHTFRIDDIERRLVRLSEREQDKESR